jgi:eukaryotic-like serine/threonine-protein kinase
MPSMEPKAGARIGRFELENCLGAGGMGAVWSARDAGSGEVIALKILHPHLAARPEARERLLREAKASKIVQHPAVLPVREVVEVEGTVFLVMDLLRGETLRSVLTRETRLGVPQTAAIASEVAGALRAAHAAGVVHRDLKPENVFLVSAASAADTVRVLDFGVAKIFEGHEVSMSPLTALGALLGTIAYMAPEQVTGAGTVDSRADVWALGVVLYEALVGFRPIEGQTQNEIARRLLTDAITPISALVSDVPDEIALLVGRMLNRSPERRPSIDVVGESLARFRG